MKWLKRFNESIEEKLYKEINEYEFEEECLDVNTSRYKEDFTNQEIQFIEQMSKDMGYHLDMNEDWFNLYKYEGDDPFLECSKTIDEWFYVSHSYVHWECEYYKCDSWEGLLQFLKEKEILK